MTMFNVLLIIIAIAAGALWLYDSVTAAGKRRKLNQDEPVYVSYARGICLILAIIVIIRVTNVGILPLLFVLTVVSLAVWLVDKWIFEKKRKAANIKEPMMIDYARSLWWIFLLVLIVRAFIIQPFRVPTGSLEPTVMPNDFIAVSQFAYGLRLPITHTKILAVGEPKVGDIAVFRYPPNPGIDYVKRVVGVPGDHVAYKNKVLYINGKEMKQTLIKNSKDVEPASLGGNVPSKLVRENLMGVKHDILIHDKGYTGQPQDFSVTVPKGYYFMMGDNRDNSGDSRVWGFVPEKNLIGKAFMIWLSWDHGVRWDRMGNKL